MKLQTLIELNAGGPGSGRRPSADAVERANTLSQRARYASQETTHDVGGYKKRDEASIIKVHEKAADAHTKAAQAHENLSKRFGEGTSEGSHHAKQATYHWEKAERHQGEL